VPHRPLSMVSSHLATTSPASFRPIFVVKPILRPGKAKKQPPSIRRSSTTGAPGALARLGVARANALQARNSTGVDTDVARTRAIAAYKDFLTLWKDADPEIPIYKEARAEYAKLQ
jgi:hypothetical protein